METSLTKIRNKINLQQKLKNEIESIDSILSNDIHILSDIEINELKKERVNLEQKIIKSNLGFKDKFKDFIYDFSEIDEVKDVEWLIKDVIPAPAIGVIYGKPGTGKTTLILEFCIQILKNSKDTYVIYIDADMSIVKLKEIGINKLINQYQDRFLYAGKYTENLIEKTQNFLKEIVEMQKKYKRRKYLVIEDSLTLLTPKKNGFVDTSRLYKYEKLIRQAGGNVVIIHHLNKAGVFADSQQIENFADYTYLVERNDFNDCILLIPRKASRFKIKEKAYKTEDRKIISEIEYKLANISFAESNFVNIMIDLFQDGEMNQSEIMKYLKQASFFTKNGVGEKKIIFWLEKWTKEGKWSFEQRSSEKNAKYYFLNQTAKLAKLPNYNNKEL